MIPNEDILGKIAKELSLCRRQAATDHRYGAVDKATFDGYTDALNHIRKFVSDLRAEVRDAVKPKPTIPVVYVGMTLKECQRELTRATLAAHHGNKTKTARALGVERRTLYRILKRHGLYKKGG